MALLKNTIFIALLLLFSLKFARCQENYEENGGWENTEVIETIPVEEWYPPVQEETVWETITPNEEAPVEEMPVTEETVIVEEEVIDEGGSAEQCPRFIEETEVNGHWMTFHPCCVSSETFCNGSYEPVCIEKESCEADHCRYRYETINNVCNACKGHDNWLYSHGKCPWEKN